MEPGSPSSSLLPPPSGLVWGWDQSGVCRGRSGHRRGRGRVGGTRAGRLCAGPGPGPGCVCRGHCLKAGPGPDSLCTCPSATQGHGWSWASPEPVPRGFPYRRPSRPFPRAHAKAPACKGSARRESKEEPCPGGKGGTPVRTWEAVGHTCGAGGGGRVRKPTPPSLQSFPPGTHGLRGGGHRGGHRGGTGSEDITVARWGWCQRRGCELCFSRGVCGHFPRGQGRRAGGLRPGAAEGLRLPLPPCPLRGQSAGTCARSVLS